MNSPTLKKLLSAFILVVFALIWGLLPDAVQAQRQDKPIEEQEEKPQGRTTLSVAVEQVQVDITVQDKDGNLIQGLRKEHFKVYEEKVEQTVTFFTPVEAPITAILVTEFSSVIPWEWLYEAWLGSHMFADQMRPEDWVAVVAYDIRPEILVDFTQNKAEVYNALRKLNSPAFRESNLYDAVYDVIDRVQDVEGKVTMVLIKSPRSYLQVWDPMERTAPPMRLVPWLHQIPPEGREKRVSPYRTFWTVTIPIISFLSWAT